jgi:hypothetical protein
LVTGAPACRASQIDAATAATNNHQTQFACAHRLDTEDLTMPNNKQFHLVDRSATTMPPAVTPGHSRPSIASKLLPEIRRYA